MTDEWNDQDLGKAFAELREGDAATTPPFGPVYAAALAAATRRKAIAPRRRAVSSAAAAAVVLAIAGAGWLSLHSRVSPLSPRFADSGAPAFSLSTWRSPTAFLLHGPNDMLLNTLPTITASPAELNVLGLPAGPRRRS